MKAFVFFLLFLPVLSIAQTKEEAVFSIRKPDFRIYLQPNFDTLSKGNDTLLSNYSYSYDLVGIDSSSIEWAVFSMGKCKMKKYGDQNMTRLTITPSYVVNAGIVQTPRTAQLLIYRKPSVGEPEICFSASFIVKPIALKQDFNYR